MLSSFVVDFGNDFFLVEMFHSSSVHGVECHRKFLDSRQTGNQTIHSKCLLALFPGDTEIETLNTEPNSKKKSVNLWFFPWYSWRWRLSVFNSHLLLFLWLVLWITTDWVSRWQWNIHRKFDSVPIKNFKKKTIAITCEHNLVKKIIENKNFDKENVVDLGTLCARKIFFSLTRQIEVNVYCIRFTPIRYYHKTCNGTVCKAPLSRDAMFVRLLRFVHTR